LPDHPEAGLEDERCPLTTGCDMAGGQCVCDARHTCLGSFTFPDLETCMKARKSEGRSHEHRDHHREKYVGPSNPACTFSGCNLTADGCVCESQSCHHHFAYANRSQCQEAAVSPKCVHTGKEFSEGEVYRMDPCWLCQCRGGISFCSKAECAEVDCENFYIPEGECCPVCIDVELLSMDSTKASCWVNNKLRAHEEQWKEDDCTFCQCVDGGAALHGHGLQTKLPEPRQDPWGVLSLLRSPMLCPPLENCSLSGNDCPYGFHQDRHGCLLCQCLSSRFPFPHASTSQHVIGSFPSARNKHGCEMCRCVKCPPFTCDRHCSDGYRQNRKGCSICSCKESVHVPSTTVPVVLPNYCFTSNGRRYEEGDGWHDGCRDCYCHSGREMCVLISCPVPSCSHPVVRPDQCCPTCEDETLSPLLPVNNSQQEYCITSDGDVLLAGDSWKANACTSCTCNNGTIQCFSQRCPAANCRVPVLRKGQCCPHCLGEGSRSQVSLTQGRFNECPGLTLHVGLSLTDERGLGDSYPNQMEMALIYQSAALDPGRSPAGHHHLSRCGFTRQQEEEVGADVLLQRSQEDGDSEEACQQELGGLHGALQGEQVPECEERLWDHPLLPRHEFSLHRQDDHPQGQAEHWQRLDVAL
ncbi:unnamed protein product, partial [Lampetra planeri]